ncbi:hypothetical protein ACFXKC_44865 [Streptomyces sp. NPDC059340]|uniref:Mu transposase domain-containing protein n=1 Tax=Streptomyces sp. NPDC059340 TaxID=3346806 RepID=UPI0036B3214F
MDRSGQVSVRTNRYSVPVWLIGRQVRVLLHACASPAPCPGRPHWTEPRSRQVHPGA